MIVRIQGVLVEKSPTEVVVDVNGVGYGMSIPLSTFEKLGPLNSKATLFTYLHVREDTQQLYGFATESERAFFRTLISVSGIGPRMAQGILSGIAVTDLRRHIAAGNYSALTKIPGVGKKLAERMVVELKEKFSKMEGTAEVTPHDGDRDIRAEALMALTSLGYSRHIAEKAVQSAFHELNGEASLENLIKTALRLAAK